MPAPVEFTFETAEVRARLALIATKMPLAFGRALYEEALIETKESIRRTPRDTGALRGSHETGRPEHKGRDISVTIRVGGPAAGYAVHVHENLEADHPVGRAKFLESTINESAPHMPSRVSVRMRTFGV